MFQIHECFKGTVQLLLVGLTGSSIASVSLPIESLNYTDGFYEMNWKIKLHNHSLYYLTISALDTLRTTTGVTEISKTMKFEYYQKPTLFSRAPDIIYYIFNTQIHIM